jgi:serine/threonine protein kinase
MDVRVVSLEDITRELLQSKFTSREGLSDYLDTFPPEKYPQDAAALARAMVRDGRLTPYQAKMALEGNAAFLLWGQYRLTAEIGEGGMGQVFKVSRPGLVRPAAIKILRRELMGSAEIVARFHREVSITTRLNHPNIVRTYEAGEQNGYHYLVMEYVEGEDLATRIEQCGPPSPMRAIDCVIQAARGLEYAHSQHIVHRDVKPSNLLLDCRGTIKITDMGLARSIETADGPQDATVDQRLTQSGQYLGTADYMSPEQAIDARNCDCRSDIYSLGCTLYRLLTGNAVYAAESRLKKLLAHASAPIPSLTKAVPRLPQQMNRVFAKMLAKIPEDRFQSMPEVIDNLLGCLAVLETENRDERADAHAASPELSDTASVVAVEKRNDRTEATLIARHSQTVVIESNPPAEEQAAADRNPKS